MIRSIVYATDLGIYAPYVLQHALALARSFKASLYVVHAVEPMGLYAQSVLKTYLDEHELEELQHNGLNSVMKHLKERVLAGFREEIDDLSNDIKLIKAVHVRQGDPPSVILDEVRQLGADLLVLGSHSHGTNLSVPLGRTASRLVQLCEVPVYLVPMLQHRTHSGSSKLPN
ncbi:universal stress protein [Ectopseudomonas mendocina]|uniref:Universal stress protein n=1 Tax=Ectopseudomonas mendocina TaxID=300 RepID=A0ABZ2RFT1_ECTME